MFKWIDKKVQDYCTYLLDVKVKEIDAHVEDKVETAKDEFDDGLRGFCKVLVTRIDKLKEDSEKQVTDKTTEFEKLLGTLNLEEELSKCFQAYVKENFVTMEPMLVERATKALEDLNSKYNLVFKRVASIGASGESTISGNGSRETSFENAELEAKFASYEKAKTQGKLIGADVVVVEDLNFMKKSWGSQRNGSFKTKGDATINVTYYKISGVKSDLPSEIVAAVSKTEIPIIE